jgi:predicted DCC family thiol-disulfide oxidoreductase YuxK
MNLSLLNSLCYTVGWVWCVLLGIHGHAFWAVVGALSILVFQLYFTKKQSLGLYIEDLFIAIFSIPLGILLEMFFIQSDMIHYVDGGWLFPPIWIVALYPLFSLLLNHSLKFFKKSYLACFLFGVLGAPLCYIAGRALGGLTFPHSLFLTWIVVGVSWGLFICLLAKIANVIEKASDETLADRDSKIPLELLYDGECPLCSREVCYLQKGNRKPGLKFIDISSKEFLPLEHSNIDYDTAMSQIHAIEGKEKHLVGLSAFASVYARCGLPVTSTLFRIPFVRVFLNPMYKVFAKYRLRITGRD